MMQRKIIEIDKKLTITQAKKSMAPLNVAN
jgi:hypothetical protein